MRETAMIRMRRVLGAMKQAEQARLAAVRQAAAAARNEAAALRRSSAGLAPGRTASDMVAIGAWQRHAEVKAQAAEARAREIDAGARPLEQALAQTIGREAVVDSLIGEAAAEHARLMARRSETG